VADFGELSLRYRLEIALYPWRRIDPVPWTALARPLAESRVALVTSAGLYRPSVDPPFVRSLGGDTSHRVVPDSVDVRSLAIGQTSDAFDRAPLEADRNMGLPLDPLHELVRAGVVGSSAPRHISINGSITAPGRLVRKTGPRVADILRADQVDVALFVPV
jgi:D-proline reductase (dithiol) PrdB